MAKMELGKIAVQERKKALRDLWSAVETMTKQGDLQLFLEHLLTDSEQIMLARRIQIALHLLQGLNHRSITEKLHVGLSTVQRVDRWLSGYKDYRKVLPSLYLEYRKKPGKQPPASPYTFRWLRKKYPLHFLLINLLIDGWDGKGNG